MIGERIEGYTWQSAAMLAATLEPDGTVVIANPALERLTGGLAGIAFETVIQPAQRDAFARRLAAAEPVWSSANFAFATGGAETATDRRVWLRHTGESVLVIAEPAVGEQEHLVEKVLELNDELVVAHRELVRQREELQLAADRIRNLEAISAAGLMNLRLDDLLGEVLRIIAEAVGSERAVLLLLDEDGEHLVARAAVGLEGLVSLADIRVPVGAGVAGSIAAENAPRVIADLSKVDVHSAYLRESSRSMAGVPLRLDGDVIGVLHVSSGELDRFGEDDLGLLVPAAERAALAIGRARSVERERRIAETLQRSLLPDVLPEVEGVRMAARFLPGAGVEVGGDWYDALPLPTGELALVIGDVAGKGLRAATLMGELRAGLRAYAIEGGGPMETLVRLNRLALRLFHMATVALVHVAPDLERITYASAGHLPPLLLAADGSARFLERGASTPLLALREDVEDGSCELHPGDRVVLYTDGLVERRREPIDESLERLRSAADGYQGPVEALCAHLIEALRPPAGAALDDTAVIALERCG